VVLREEFNDEVWKFIESELRPIPGQTERRLNRHALEEFTRMRDAARRDGITLLVLSSDRTPQRAAEGAARASNPYAVASFSSHTLGLAIDFRMSHGDQTFRETTTRPMQNIVDMRRSPVHKWLFLRGAQYGWFPYQHEPWHWEFNPEGFRERYWEGYTPPETR
jgi:LAS superfamily LD-carboxypeptidase LdcB